MQELRDDAVFSASTWDSIKHYAKRISREDDFDGLSSNTPTLDIGNLHILLHQSKAQLPINKFRLEEAELAGAILINIAVLDGFVGTLVDVAKRIPGTTANGNARSTFKRALSLQVSHEIVSNKKDDSEGTDRDEHDGPEYGSPQLRKLYLAWQNARWVAPLFAGLALEFRGKGMMPAAGRVANLKPVDVLAVRTPERIKRALSYALWFRDFATSRMENNQSILAPELTIGINIAGLEPQLPDQLPCIKPEILDQLISNYNSESQKSHPLPGEGLYHEEDDVRVKLIRHRIYNTDPLEQRIPWPFPLAEQDES